MFGVPVGRFASALFVFAFCTFAFACPWQSQLVRLPVHPLRAVSWRWRWWLTQPTRARFAAAHASTERICPCPFRTAVYTVSVHSFSASADHRFQGLSGLPLLWLQRPFPFKGFSGPPLPWLQRYTASRASACHRFQAFSGLPLLGLQPSFAFMASADHRFHGLSGPPLLRLQRTTANRAAGATAYSIAVPASAVLRV